MTLETIASKIAYDLARRDLPYVYALLKAGPGFGKKEIARQVVRRLATREGFSQVFLYEAREKPGFKSSLEEFVPVETIVLGSYLKFIEQLKASPKPSLLVLDGAFHMPNGRDLLNLANTKQVPVFAYSSLGPYCDDWALVPGYSFYDSSSAERDHNA